MQKNSLKTPTQKGIEKLDLCKDIIEFKINFKKTGHELNYKTFFKFHLIQLQHLKLPNHYY